MKITNKHGVPDSVYAFLSQEFYDYDPDPKVISATMLLKPIQEIVLLRRYHDLIEVDAMEQLWSVLGSGVHAALEQIEGKPPERLYADVLGWRVSGKPDRITDRIEDYKVTSAWTVVYGSRNDEWAAQMSIYRWLYWKNTGIALPAIGRSTLILRDWDKKKVGGKYPDKALVAYEIPLDSLSETERFVTGKVAEVQEAEGLVDSELPHCNLNETWWNEKQQRHIKCEDYCNARAFCRQFQSTKQEESSYV